MSSFDRVAPQMWMMLGKDERDRLAHVFKIEATGITEVRDNEVLTDGFKYEDLAGITKEKMTEYVGSEESYPRLWELTVAKVRSELHPPVGVIKKTDGQSSGITLPREVRKRVHPVKPTE